MKKLASPVLLVAALLFAACGGPADPRTLDARSAAFTTSRDGSHKVTICHATASAKNPFVVITIDESGLAGHIPHHEGDFFAVDGQCVVSCPDEPECPATSTGCMPCNGRNICNNQDCPGR